MSSCASWAGRSTRCGTPGDRPGLSRRLLELPGMVRPVFVIAMKRAPTSICAPERRWTAVYAAVGHTRPDPRGRITFRAWTARGRQCPVLAPGEPGSSRVRSRSRQSIYPRRTRVSPLGTGNIAHSLIADRRSRGMMGYSRHFDVTKFRRGRPNPVVCQSLPASPDLATAP